MLERASFAIEGTEVEGVLHLPDGEVVGGVIEMGGGAMEHGAYVCEALAGAGIAALRFAFRVRPAGGKTVDAMAGLADAAAALRVLRAHPAVPQRIGLVGHSFGGVIAALVAGQESQLSAVALLAAPAERPQLGSLSPPTELSRTRAPVLLVYGSADERVPLSDGERYAAVLSQARVSHRLIVIEGSDHLFSEPAHRAQMLDALAGWMRSSLTG